MQTNKIIKIVSRLHITCATAVIGAFLMPSAQATLLELTPPNQVVEVGSSVEVVLRISGLGSGEAPSLGGFDVFLNFDSALLTYDSVVFGDLLGPVMGSQTGVESDQNAGSLNLFGVSFDTPADLDALQPEEFELAIIRFTVNNPGGSLLDFSSVLLGDGLGNEIIPWELRSATITADGLCVCPEGSIPFAGLLLMFLGLLGTGRFSNGPFR